PPLGRTSLLTGLLLVALCELPLSAPAGEKLTLQTDPAVTVRYNVMVPMRDGVRLSTDIYRPTKEGKYPVILLRDPYLNGMEAWGATLARLGYECVKNGYVFLHQDVRGRNDSEGKFYPYFSEPQDGYDVQQWAGSQPWSNGKVGLWG